MTQHEDPTPDVSNLLAPVFGTLLVAMMVASIALYACFGNATPWGQCYESEQEDGGPPPEYRQWDKPLVALVLTGQMHGYVDPCGCSFPQYGGLVRRYSFIQSLTSGTATKKNEKWDVVGIDLGEFAQHKGIQEQNLLKFKLTVQALAKSNYRAFGIGADEILMPLGDALAPVWDKKAPYPRPTSLSLAQTAPGQHFHELNVRPWEIIDNTNPKIGVINIMGPDLREKLKDQEKFVNSMKELPRALKAFADARVEIGIILHHEYPELDPKIFPPGGLKALQRMAMLRQEQALECAKFCDAERQKNSKIPPIHLTMILTSFSDPSLVLQQVDPKLPTQIVEVGHKGKYVGLVGVYRDKKGFRFQYQPVRMDPEFEPTAKEKATHPIINLFEQYTQELKRQDVMSKYVRTVHFNQLVKADEKGLRARYVGSERCGDCHARAYKIWDEWQDPAKKVKGHARATNTLEDIKFPSNRNFDPECMKCHTTGMQHPTGYNDFVPDITLWPMKQKFTAKQLETHNNGKIGVGLRGVGCESCHGPGSEHVKDKDNKALYELINPFGPNAKERTLEKIANRTADQEKDYQQLFQARMGQLNIFCMKCHDDENDVNWGQPGHQIIDKWIGKGLIHRTNPLPMNQPNGPMVVQPPAPMIEVIEDKKK